MFREDYVKEKKIVDKTEQEHEIDLYQDLEKTKRILNSLHENLNYASADLVDYYTYQIKAEEAKYPVFN